MRAAIAAALLLALPAAAQSLYKWVDEKGVTHYTQEPPPNGNASKLDVKVEPGRAAPDDWKARELDSRRKKIESEGKSRVEEQRKALERAARCDRARSSLDQLRNSRRLYKLDAKGERVYLEDDQRPALIEKAQADVREYCP